ncbi:MAG: gliding motility-associated C-terminal domain-containing protein [Saprospiraceae bacterium]|nr:gliding motility-associated C-terminal domain-containing protein [Saprospiraceae bacterium]
MTGFDLYLNGTPLNNPNGCNFVPTTAYSYTLLPGAGFGGPYSLDTWTVNGNSFSGFFNNANELLTLMQTFDPSGNWAINTTLGLVFGGNPATNYGDMEVTHLPSGTPAMLNINTTSLPTGFNLALTSPGFAVLIAENPLTGCADTLVINSSLDPTETDTIFLTTTVNTPTTTNCLSGSELPGGNIVNVGYCQSPDFGVAPLSSPNCVFYIPSLNFAGQDAFCMVACDGGFPQVCDTTYFFVNVLPQNDTVYLTIPAGENTIDSCLTSFVVELPGPVTSASFCSINTAEISGTVAGNCLTFTGNGNFYGTTTACVSFCSGGFCEENTVIVTIVPPVACDEVFDETTLDFTSATPDNFLCIPIPTGEIVNYQVTIDGVPYTQSFTPCGFDVLSVYDVSGLPAGPFTINSWTANGTLHTGVVANLAALVGQMNAWDPNGGWVLIAGTQSIQGGQGGTYSNLVITPAGGATQTLARSLVQLPLGSQVAITGFGNHLVTVTAANGCSDNVTVVFNQQVVTTETLVFNTTPSTSVGQLCANTDDLIGNLFSISPCGLPSNGAFVSNTATCFTYTPNLGFIGSDTACVVVCDDNFIPVCDTFIFIINVEPVTDTLFLNLGNTAAVDTCLGSDFIQLSGVVLSSSICGANQNEVTLTLAANCVNIDLADNFTGTTTACVVHCDDSTPPICDTTYLVITNTSNPNPCPTLFNPDEVLISLQSGVGEVCLPISPVTMMGLNVILDGQPVSGQLMPCNVDQVVIYAYGQVFGQGAMGPYSVAWTINGQNFSSVVQNMQGLVDQMNIWDNVGNWNIEQPTFSIISTNDNGVYGNLIITHIATGLLSTIAPAFNGLPLGTAVPISGAGQHTIIVENPADGCSDTLTINALNGVDQLDVFTSENVTSNVYCIDTLGLPGTFQQMSVCQLPANGIIAINENCFSFTPNTGFIGADAGCLVVCDNLGNCDTTLLNITVGPLCSLFDVFPDTTAQIQVASCADIAGVCTPILLDSIANYGVLDNGFPYAGNFVVCNGQFAQVALDTGLHEVVFLHFATGCQDTLFVLVSCTDDDGCGTVPLSPLTLQVDDCNDGAQFCVSVPVTDLPNFLITDNGAAFGGNIGFCDLSMTNVGLTVDTGLHVLILEDTVKGCADTFVVNVLCTIIQDVTVDTLVPQGNTIELCLEDFGYLTSDVDSVAVVCASNGNTSYVVDEQTWCITFTGEEIGLDTACFEVFVGDTSAIFTVNIEVISPCPVLIPGGVLASSIDCSLDSGLLCLPFDIIDLLNKTMELDGVVYPASQLQGCGLTSIFRFNYDALPSQGLLGPYILENWNVNGTDFTGVFNTIQELADSMNLWDPSGNWQVVVDPNTGANLIQGGDASNNYGNLTIEQQISGIQVELGLGLTTIPTGIAITLEVGLPHTLTITDTLTNCTETAILELVCLTSDVVQDTIMLGAVDTFCLDLSELLGDVASVTNLCPGSNGEIVGFTVDSTCVIYQGNEPGLDSACFVVCDVTGLCDTTYFFVTVGFAGDSLPIAVDDIVFTDQGNASNINVLGNDTVQFLLGIPSIVEPPLHGDVQVLPDGTINYVPTDPNYCDEDTPDSFTYSICNPAGCDTATVFVTIFCSGLSIVEAFSPNGDNKNETFKITGLQNYPGHHLYIYNRWGLLVHEATNYLSDWEGTYKDKILPDGTYFYVLDLGTGDKPETGFVVILR